MDKKSELIHVENIFLIELSFTEIPNLEWFSLNSKFNLIPILHLILDFLAKFSINSNSSYESTLTRPPFDKNSRVSFSCLNGPKFYKLAPNKEKITFKKLSNKVSDLIDIFDENKTIGKIKPFHAGETLNWKVLI